MAAAQAVIGRQAQQQTAAGPQHAPELGQGRARAGYRPVVEDVEGSHEVEGAVRKGQAGDAGLGQPDEAAIPAEVEGQRGEVDAGHPAEWGQIAHRAAGAAARVQDVQVVAAAVGFAQQRLGDAPHAGVPPVPVLDGVDGAVFGWVHETDYSAGAAGSGSTRRRTRVRPYGWSC